MYYVETTNSPADDDSRGLESRHQEKIKKWFEGPPFLWRKEHLLRKCSIFEQVLDDDPEIKKVHKVNAVQVENGVLVRLQRLTWNWTRMKRLMANEKKYLIEGKTVPRGSRIVKLDPFLDDKGIMRVGDRLKRLCLAEE